MAYLLCREPKLDIYVPVTFALFIYLPMIGVIYTSTLVAITMKRQSVSVRPQRAHYRKRKEQQAMKQLFLIVCSFLIAYFPYTGNLFQ